MIEDWSQKFLLRFLYYRVSDTYIQGVRHLDIMRHYLIINGCLRPNNTVSDTNNNWRDDIWPQKSRLSKFLLLLPITYFLVEAGERSR